MKTQENTKLLQDLVRARIQSSIELKQVLLADSAFHDLVAHVAMQIVKSLRGGGKVMFFGNGGSAADAQHLAAEFTGRYLKERRAPDPAGNIVHGRQTPQCFWKLATGSAVIWLRLQDELSTTPACRVAAGRIAAGVRPHNDELVWQ